MGLRLRINCSRTNRDSQLDSPLSWLSRDHRKTVSVDGAIGFVSGLCVGQMWVGNPSRNVEPWRDTGVELRGPAVTDLEHAFATLWATLGDPIAPAELIATGAEVGGEVALRVVASVPQTAGLLPVSELAQPGAGWGRRFRSRAPYSPSPPTGTSTSPPSLR